MRVKIHEEIYEEQIMSDNPAVSCKIIYPRVEYPFRTESEVRLNDEIFSIALSRRSFIRNAVQGKEDHSRGEYITNYSVFIRPSYTDNLFISFILESVITTNTKKAKISYSAKTYKISSARNLTLEMLFTENNIKEILREKVNTHSDFPGKITAESFSQHYKNTNFYLTHSGIVLLFAPDTIIPGYDKYLHLLIRYDELKGHLKYRFV